ncbi:hypothetical protein [uncultured Ruegeria sp.]|uniref:LIC10280 family protein n=1 Tax=uncultured Ruegeria sp. TaxID=259304 RepID=UPI0026152EF3|nr:hypothetical protein [uncultured Ruegeria sp.]
MNRRIGTAMALAGSVLLSSQAFAADVMISGEYSTQGRNVEGEIYKGIASVVQTGSHVDIVWVIGGHTYQGTGDIDGNTVTVDWGEHYPVVYLVKSDGELHGTWADGLAFDKMTPK